MAVINVKADEISTLSQHRLLIWLNQTLNSNFVRIDQMKNCAAYCQLVHMMFPEGINLGKVAFSLRPPMANNLQILKTSLKQLRIVSPFNLDVCTQGKISEQLKVLQFFKRLHENNYKEREYDAMKERKNISLGYSRRLAQAAVQQPKQVKCKMQIVTKQSKATFQNKTFIKDACEEPSVTNHCGIRNKNTNCGPANKRINSMTPPSESTAKIRTQQVRMTRPTVATIASPKGTKKPATIFLNRNRTQILSNNAPKQNEVMPRKESSIAQFQNINNGANVFASTKADDSAELDLLKNGQSIRGVAKQPAIRTSKFRNGFQRWQMKMFEPYRASFLKVAIKQKISKLCAPIFLGNDRHEDCRLLATANHVQSTGNDDLLGIKSASSKRQKMGLQFKSVDTFPTKTQAPSDECLDVRSNLSAVAAKSATENTTVPMPALSGITSRPQTCGYLSASTNGCASKASTPVNITKNIIKRTVGGKSNAYNKIKAAARADSSKATLHAGTKLKLPYKAKFDFPITKKLPDDNCNVLTAHKPKPVQDVGIVRSSAVAAKNAVSALRESSFDKIPAIGISAKTEKSPRIIRSLTMLQLSSNVLQIIHEFYLGLKGDNLSYFELPVLLENALDEVEQQAGCKAIAFETKIAKFKKMSLQWQTNLEQRLVKLQKNSRVLEELPAKKPCQSVSTQTDRGMSNNKMQLNNLQAMLDSLRHLIAKCSECCHLLINENSNDLEFVPTQTQLDTINASLQLDVGTEMFGIPQRAQPLPSQQRIWETLVDSCGVQRALAKVALRGLIRKSSKDLDVLLQGERIKDANESLLMQMPKSLRDRIYLNEPDGDSAVKNYQFFDANRRANYNYQMIGLPDLVE